MAAHILQNHYVLAVHDLEASARFFCEALGFQVHMEPPGWVMVKRDNVMVMLGHCADASPAAELGDHNWFAYLRVDDVDAYHAEVVRHYPAEPPVTKPWGMRDFVVHTPEGHRIVI